MYFFVSHTYAAWATIAVHQWHQFLTIDFYVVFVISWHVTHFQIESCGGRLTGRILGVNDSKFAINSNRKFRHSTLPSDLQQMFVRLVNEQCVVCRDYDDVFYKVVDISAKKERLYFRTYYQL